MACKSVKSAIITASAQKATSQLAEMVLIILTQTKPSLCVFLSVFGKNKTNLSRLEQECLKARQKGKTSLLQDINDLLHIIMHNNSAHAAMFFFLQNTHCKLLKIDGSV